MSVEAVTPGLADRLLLPFSDVRAGEGLTALAMLVNLFLLLAGYYVLKTLREPLILLAGGGAELKSYAAAGQALALMGFVPLYSWFAARVDRLRLIIGLVLFFALNIELFAFGLAARLPYLGFVFFIWVGIFSLATIAQFWSYANDLYRREAGERLFPVIAIGATVGSPVGAKIAQTLFDSGVTPSVMLHLAAAMLLAHLFLYWLIERRSPAAREKIVGPGESLRGAGGFRLVWENPFLCWVACFLLCLNVVNTTGEYIIGRSVLQAAQVAVAAGRATDSSSFIGSFYGEYFFWVNVSALMLQAFVASRIVKRLGAPGAILALPFVALGVYGLIGAGVGFSIMRWAKTAENATDYSLMNTGRQLLWLPTTREEKYKAKQAIDTFFVRAGDMVSAGVVFAGTAWLHLGVTGFARVNVVVVGVWLALGYLVVRSYRRLCVDCP